MNNNRWYPAWVFSVREDVTRANMARYDRQQAQVDSKCLDLAPDFRQLTLREQFEIRRNAREILGF